MRISLSICVIYYKGEGCQQVLFFLALDDLLFIGSSAILVHRARIGLRHIESRLFLEVFANKSLIETISKATTYTSSVLAQDS